MNQEIMNEQIIRSWMDHFEYGKSRHIYLKVYIFINFIFIYCKCNSPLISFCTISYFLSNYIKSITIQSEYIYVQIHTHWRLH